MGWGHYSLQDSNFRVKIARTFGFVGTAKFNYRIAFSSPKHSVVTTGLLFPLCKPSLVQSGLSFQIKEFPRPTTDKDMC